MFKHIQAVLAIADVAEKCAAVNKLCERLGPNADFSAAGPVEPIVDPGRPGRPQLVHPTAVPKRRLGSVAGRAALVHAVAHIEFNAINLALDAAYRFRGMPQQYYLDWLSVAQDEARHFSLLSARLESLGYAYGDFPAHNGLWEMAQKTAADCLVRMALVPRVLEARGLDVTPAMISRLEVIGDTETVAILQVILSEEVRHVEIGSYWYKHLCGLRDLNPEKTFLQLLRDYYGGRIKGPFNESARLEAGFTAEELRGLNCLSTPADGV